MPLSLPRYPYLTSGRLILGPLLPFLAVYLRGFVRLLAKLSLERFRPALLLIILLPVTASEIALSHRVFQSRYNTEMHFKEILL